MYQNRSENVDHSGFNDLWEPELWYTHVVIVTGGKLSNVVNISETVFNENHE